MLFRKGPLLHEGLNRSVIRRLSKPAGFSTVRIVSPELSGMNCDWAVLDPAAIVTGELIVPTPGLLLLRKTCTGETPPRNNW